MEAQWLGSARAMNLNVVARSVAAREIVAALVPLVVAVETRGNQRRASSLERLTNATAAVVGGLLLTWRQGVPAYRTLHLNDLVSPVAGGRQLRAALDGLVATGHMIRVDGRRFKLDWGDASSSHGIAPRFWPASSLLALAVEKGITPATVRNDFALISAEKPRPVRDAVTRKPLVAPGRKRQTGVTLPIDYDQDATACALRHSVEQFNAFALLFKVEGCDPPQWRRAYADCWALGGRWTSVATGRCYQQMKAAERVASIAIDRTHVVEIDVRGSHLTIMHGLLGLPLPTGGSLYDGLGVPETVAKAWVTGTLGKGSPVRKWGAQRLRETPEIASHHAVEVGRAVLARYPFLQDPAHAVSHVAGLADLKHDAKPATLLTHRLMAIEAEAITAAMETLQAAGQLALPLHDSILVRGPYEPEAVAALQDAFRVHAGIVPRLTIDRPDMRRAAA